MPPIAVDQRAVASAQSRISRIDRPAIAASMAARGWTPSRKPLCCWTPGCRMRQAPHRSSCWLTIFSGPTIDDVLMYLVAGPADRRFALLATVRSQSVPDGHPFHRWLADALRLPRVTHLDLQPLDRAGTEAQVGSLLGTVPHQTLVDDVFAHTLGNPYLNILVTADLEPTARRLPDDLPADLRVAVRRTWHSLSPLARDITSLVAVGGRPVRPELLQDVADDLGLGEVGPALQEAEESQILTLVEAERYWFQHPLQAQVLEQSLTTSRRRRWHAAYARCGEASLVSGSPLTFDLAVTLTGHHDQAGHRREAYVWSLRSWELAGDARGSSEMLNLMRRAVELREGLEGAAESVTDLLWRLRETAEAVGADVDELAVVNALLEVTDRVAEPLVASELLVRRMMLRATTGAGFIEVEDIQVAAELASVAPSSWQYALALAEIAHAGTWTLDPERARYAAYRACHCTWLGQSPSPLLCPDGELDGRCRQQPPRSRPGPEPKQSTRPLRHGIGGGSSML